MTGPTTTGPTASGPNATGVPAETGSHRLGPGRSRRSSRAEQGRRARPPVRGGRPIRVWVVTAGLVVVLVVGALGLLDPMLTLLVTGVLLSALPRAGCPVARGRTTIAVGVTMLLAYLGFAAGLSALAYVRSVPTVLLVAVLALSTVIVALPLAMPAVDGGGLAMTRRDLIAAATGLVVLTVAHAGGTTYLVLAVTALALPVTLASSRFLGRAPAAFRLTQAVNILAFAALLAATALPGTYDTLPPGGSTPRFVIIGGALAAAVLAFVPARRTPLATNVLLAAVSAFLITQLVPVYRTPADAVTLSAPFAGEWYVAHGGHAELVNGHRASPSQRDALDILAVVDGSTHRDGDGLNAYYAYGEPLLAPADGTVVSVSDIRADRPVGSPDPANPAGNTIVLDIGGGRYVLLAHLQHRSALVLPGNRVRDGQALARVGNSGNSDEPHLHIQVQDSPTTDIHHAGVRTVPIVFRDVELIRGGDQTRPVATDLRRGDAFRATTR